MKTKILLLSIALLFNACWDDDDSNATLPPATQTGAGTFACHVNGQSFIDTSGGWFNCYYQYVDGGYYFSVGGIDDDDDTLMMTVILETNSREIHQGETLILSENIEGNAWGGGRFNVGTSGEGSYTNSEYTGELTITKLDFVHGIVSGTFWFDIPHPITGETVEIRDGRFDTLFTQ